MNGIGKMLLILGVFLTLTGAAIMLAGKLGIPFGKLPGDITYHKKNVTVFFPLGTMLVISLTVSLILNLYSRWK